MRILEPGRLCLAVAFAVLGGLIVGVHGFAPQWPTVPKWFVWHDGSVAVCGAIMLAGGMAMLVPRFAKPAALVLAAFVVVRLLLLQIPYLVGHPRVEIAWYDVSENLTLAAGFWTVFAMLPRDKGKNASYGRVRAGQILFALAMPAIGLAHFFYVDMTTPLIPAWLPFHLALAYFTGAAHIAAGIGILFLVLPRLAATLEAVMVSLFTLLVWVPAVIAAPANLSDWREICVSTAVTGAAWAVAESFQDKRWSFARTR